MPLDTFQRPIGTLVSNEEIPKIVEDHYQASKSAREYAEAKWQVADIVLDGFFNFGIDWNTGQAFFNPGDPKGSVRTKIPELLTRFRREYGRLLSVLRPPTCRPKVTGDPNIWRANRFGIGALSYLHDVTKFEQVAAEWINSLIMQGTSGLLTYWDEFEREVAFRAIPGWQLFPFPASATDDLAMEGLIWSRVVSREWLLQNLPDAANERTIKVTTPYRNYRGDRSYFEGYEIRYVFFKPSRRFPLGEQVIIVGDKVYRRMNELPYFHSNKRVLPIAVARYTKKASSWWGESFAYPVAMLNRDLNRLMTLMMRRAVVRAHPGYLLVPQGTIEKDDLMNQVGGIVAYRPPLGNTQMTPHWLTYPSGPPDSDVMVNRVQTFLDDTSSQHAFTRGQTAGRVEATSAIEAMVRSDQIPTEGTFKQLAWGIKHAFGIALDLAYRKWDEKRRIKVVGPMGLPISLLAMGKDLPSMDDVEILTGLEMALDKPSQMDLLVKLSTPPSAGAPALLPPEEFRRGLVGLGVNLPGVNLISPDEEQAWLENQSLYGDGRTPQLVPEPNPALEDSAVHLRVHKAFAASPEVHNAADVVRQAFQEHIQRTVEVMAPPSQRPEEFDRDSTRMDADLLDEQLAVTQLGLG